MNKELIKIRFSNKLSTYSENAGIQRKMAEKLISYLKKNTFDNILEIGCGTGLLTELAVEKLDFKTYTANDIVEDCQKFIKKINSDINFVSGDIEELIRESSKKYDLIISNASLQWVDDFEHVVNNLLAKLTKGGILLFSTFGSENFREIYFVMGKKLNYYSKSELERLFGEHIEKSEEEIHIMSFKTPKDVLKHLHLTGVNAIESKSWTKKDMKNFENGYNNFCSNRPTLTYNPIYIMLSGK